MAPVLQEPEIQFAQRLASNEKPIRTKAIKKLRKYLSVRSQKPKGGFTIDELLKIWKGLFYCLWMQDKPLLQEELSTQISNLIHSLQNIDSQFLFLESFLMTINREWNGIDRLRMDKFYALVRFVFRQMFEMMKRRGWEAGVVDRFTELLSAQILRSTSGAPVGVQLHVLDIYMAELAGVGAAELTAEQNLTFIDPFCKTAAKTKDHVLLQAISSSIFHEIVDQAPFAIEDLMREVRKGGGGESDSDQEQDVESEENKRRPVPSKAGNTKGKRVNGIRAAAEDEDEDEEDDDLLGLEEDAGVPQGDDGIGPVLQFDYSALADRLFELASRSNTPSFNRKRLYKVIKIFRDLSEGVFPQDEYPEEVSTDEDDDEMFGSRKRLRKRRRNREEEPEEEEEEGSSAAKKRKDKKKEVKKPSDKQQNTVTGLSKPATSPAETQSDTTTKKKKKKKKKKKAGEAKAGEEGSGETEQSEGEKVSAEGVSETQEKMDAGSARPAVATAPSSTKETDTQAASTAPAESTSNGKVAEQGNRTVQEDKGEKSSPHRGTSEMPTEAQNGAVAGAEAQTKVDTVSQTQTETLSTKKTKKKSKKQKTVTQEEGVVLELKPDAEVEGAEPRGPSSAAGGAEGEETQPAVVEEGGDIDGVATTPTSSGAKRKKNRKKKNKEEPEQAEERPTEGEAESCADEQPGDSSSAAQLKKTKRKKRKMAAEEGAVAEGEMVHVNGHTDEAGGKKAKQSTGNEILSTPVSTSKPQKKKKVASQSETGSDFVTFQSPSIPAPLFCRKAKGSPSTPVTKKKVCSTPQSESKKVTFGLKNNKTTEFRKTDRSLMVSPEGSSRVPFDPQQKPRVGVLKSPARPLVMSSKTNSATKGRPKASDFF
ncbi:ribosomal RNA processing protein 1 homolog A-like [Megalops cyprinoides]|uniref:ribosomal RNA processing protein 1 homolog A-like n=1 Tax=Megalops cyprinoides TaxID=118141 RepID=UPI00186502AB|nr:ribosomal RNA processing protein 1 homolog A-like [Megalops cyprinoides]